MNPNSLITHRQLKEVLNYDPMTGKLFHKERFPCHFEDGVSRSKEQKCFSFNRKLANKPALETKNPKGYCQGTIFNKYYQAHRLIWFYMTGEWPEEIDHINGIRDDNRWENLRDVSSAINMKNKKKYSSNTTGETGVWFHKNIIKYQASVCIDRYQKHLGYFDTKEEAKAAREDYIKDKEFTTTHGKRT